VKRGGVMLGPDALVGLNACADEDDFHSLKRRRKEVEDVEERQERVQRIRNAAERDNQKLPALQKPQPALKKAKVVNF